MTLNIYLYFKSISVFSLVTGWKTSVLSERPSSFLCHLLSPPPITLTVGQKPYVEVVYNTFGEGQPILLRAGGT